MVNGVGIRDYSLRHPIFRFSHFLLQYEAHSENGTHEVPAGPYRLYPGMFLILPEIEIVSSEETGRILKVRPKFQGLNIRRNFIGRRALTAVKISHRNRY